MSVNYICKSLIFEFPLNVTNFFKVGVVKLVSFHMILFMKFVTFPTIVSNFCFMRMKKILVKSCSAFYLLLVSFIYSILNSYKSYLIKVATRYRRAVLCSIYVFLVLVVLLVSCFAVSGIVMTIMAEAPIHVTQTLNLDYTKPNPSAVVHISGILASKMKYNNRLRLTVSLTLPESEYNMKLGIFQVCIYIGMSSSRIFFFCRSKN